MPAYDFPGRAPAKPPALARPLQFQQLSQLGLDMVTPFDLMKSGRTPYGKNFRLYAQQSDDRQVAVSNRRGSGFYTNPLSESKTVYQESTAGASTVVVNKTTSVILQRFTAANSNRVTHIDIKVGNPNGGTGPISLQLWSDDDNRPGSMIAESSLTTIPETADWVVARFIRAPKLTNGQNYWIVLGQQDDGTGDYAISTTTNTSLAKITNSALASAVAQTFSINYRVYTVSDTVIKEGHRYARDNGNNVTVVVIGTSMYQVNEGTNNLDLIVSGLSGSATDYSFAHADNKLFWVNGYDQLTAWDGTLEATNPNLFTNPDLTTNATGWSTNPFYGGTVARSTSEYHTGPGGLSITNTSGYRAGWTPVTLKNNKRYHLSFWIKAATAGTVNVDYITQTPTVSFGYDQETEITTVAATTSWQQVDMYFTSNQAAVGIQWGCLTALGTIYLDDLSIKEVGLSYITDPELEVASQIIYHKDRLWTVSAANKNKIQWSMAPGNPPFKADNVTSEDASKQWYNAWRSVDFMYVPRPYNGSPITALVSFQDSLIVFTEDGKYVISGYDSGSFTQRESTGFQGALSRRGVTKDENNIYFVGHDGLYSFDGTYDTKISTPIDPLFNAVPDKKLITPVVWLNKVRFYMATAASTVNDTCALWNKDIAEWEYDTDTFVKAAIPYEDADDDNQLVEISSVAPVMYLAEKQYSNLGAPIDFEYRFNYNSLGTPAQKKRIKKFFPILQGVDSTFPVTISIDKDFQNSPRYKTLMLTVNGAVFGDDYELGDGTLFGGQTSFKMQKLRFSGYGYYWQMRISRKAVNNRVAFVGAQFSYKTKRI